MQCPFSISLCWTTQTPIEQSNRFKSVPHRSGTMRRKPSEMVQISASREHQSMENGRVIDRNREVSVVCRNLWKGHVTYICKK